MISEQSRAFRALCGAHTGVVPNNLFPNGSPPDTSFCAPNLCVCVVKLSAVWLQYDEIAKYNYANPTFTYDAGHFTQVVWRNSIRLGCAAVNCNGMTNWASGRFFLVCRWVCTCGVEVESVLLACHWPNAA